MVKGWVAFLLFDCSIAAGLLFYCSIVRLRRGCVFIVRIGGLGNYELLNGKNGLWIGKDEEHAVGLV